jgi:hypothetical protein
MSPSSVISSRIVPRARTRGFRSTARVAVGGLGYGNVQDRLLAREHLYHHTDEPHTVSVIGKCQISQSKIHTSFIQLVRAGPPTLNTFGYHRC